jgi:hypothetical protein
MQGVSLKEFTFSKHNAFLILPIILLTGAGILLIQQFSHQPSGETATPSPEEAEITNAAVDGTRAFFQIIVNEGKEAWLNRFCAASTESGCSFVRMGADRLWQKYQEAKAEVQAEVSALECVSSTAKEQVWRVAINLSEPLPGSNKTEDEAYVLIIKTEDGWKFDRFLLEPEVQVLKERTVQEGQ